MMVWFTKSHRFFLVWILLIAAVVNGLTGTRADAAESGIEALKRLPIQDAGRIKPFDTFARESLLLIYGRESYRPAAKDQGDSGEGRDGRERSAIEIVMTWFLAPQFWDGQEFIEIKLTALKEALKITKGKDRFSPKEIFSNDRTALVFQELVSFRETKAKLTPYFQAVQRLENQLGLYQAVKGGVVFRFVPPKVVLASDVHVGRAEIPTALPGAEANRWISLQELEGTSQQALKEKFTAVAKSFIRALPGVESAPSGDESMPSLAQAVAEFQELARAENPELYPDGRDIAIEVHYEELHPFRLAWMLYVVSAILMAFAWSSAGSAALPSGRSSGGFFGWLSGWFSGRLLFARVGWVAAVVAFLLHTYGFGLRVYLTGRPPVSNMYESVIWVSWGVMLFAMIFEAKQRLRFILMAGAIVATFCNIVADKAPHILDSSLQPLEPVLRSNLWLTVHVLTIAISYSAFFLAWALGNIGLGYAIRGEPMKSPKVESMTVSIYRCLQVGVVLLAAGIILGGVWADYSWGRFWGWDPKETWALIALLGYIAILHARLVGWVRNLGIMIWSTIAFNLVIMAWYGVNYVLGAGLHSYGFGAGGIEYVSAFILLDLAYVGFAFFMSQARRAGAGSGAGD